MIPSEIVNYAFAGGIDEKTDPWVIEAPRLSQLVNGVFTKNGQIRKRNGYAVYPKTIQGGGSLANAVSLGFRKNEQILSDGDYLYSYSPALVANSLAPNVRVDQLPQLTATRSYVDNGAVTAWDCDIGIIANGGAPIEVYAWTNANPGAGISYGDVFVTVVDATSGSTLFRSFQLTSGATYFAPHVCIVGGFAIVAYLDQAATAVKCRRFNAASPTTWAVQQTLATDIQLNTGVTAYDAIGLNDRFIIAYESSIAAPRLRLRSFDNTGSAISSAVLTGEANTLFAHISLGYAVTSSDPTLVVYSYSGNTKHAWISSTTLGVNFGPSSISNTWVANSSGSAKIDASSACVALNVNGSASIPPFWSYKIAVNSGIVGVEHRMWGFTATVKPFVVNGRSYVLGDTPASNAVTLIIDLQTDQNNTVPNHRPVATIAPRITSVIGAPRTPFNGLSNTMQLASGQFVTVGTILRSNVPGANIGTTRILISSAAPNRHHMAEIGENVHITGGLPTYYDGRGVYEIGFLNFIDASGVIATPSTTGGAIVAGTYVYSFTYEVTDAAGQRHRSATSVQKLVTVGGTTAGSVAFTNIPNLMTTCRQDQDNSGIPPIEIVVYRSVSGGTTLYRLTPELTPSTLQNGLTSQYTTYTDVYGDVLAGGGVPLATKPLLYTTGGVLDNVCPPSATLGVVHRSRLWLAGTDDPRVVWFSKQFVTGEAIAFCDSFTFSIEDRNPITAIASLDDKFVIFTRSSIYIVTGDGPTDSGVGNDLSTPQRVASDVGCIEPRSVVLMPDGLMFQSEQGIMLLDRSLSVSYLGHPVEDSLASRPVITSAVVKPDQNQAVFTTQDTASSSGGLLVYDYVQHAWSTGDVWDSDTSSAHARFISAARSPAGVYTVITNAGQFMTERPSSDPNACLDGGHWITLTIATAWLKLAGLQGFQRIRKLGLLLNGKTAYQLSVAIAFDYQSSPAQTETKTDVQLVTNPMQPIFRIGSQNGASPRCEAMQVTLTDSAPGTNPVGTGQGAYFIGLALEIARKPGLKRVGATAKW
jgi:hypothetical protein